MTERLSLIVAFAALVLSVASPLISAWISGHYRIKEIELQQKHDRELQRQQFYIQHRAEVIEKYIRSAGAEIYRGYPEDQKEFGEVSNEIYFYLDRSFWHLVETINSEIKSHDRNGAKDTLAELCNVLAYNPPRSGQASERDENSCRTYKQKNQNKKEWWPKRLFKAWGEKKTRSDGGKKAKGEADNSKDNK